MQTLCTVSMEEAKNILANSQRIHIESYAEGVTSVHEKLEDGTWTCGELILPNMENREIWTEDEFAEFLSDISVDADSYTYRTE